MDLSARPSMETMVTRYEVLQKAVVIALDARFGPQPWRAIDPRIGPVRVDCDEDEDPQGTGSTVRLPSIGFEGVYARSMWHDVREIVVRVGAEYGLTEVILQVEARDSLDFTLQDAFGATVHIGMSANTVVSGVVTGCHRLQHPPTSAESP